MNRKSHIHLTVEQIAQIFRLRERRERLMREANELSIHALAEKYNVHPNTISNVILMRARKCGRAALKK